jgi:hypothetical protein
MSDLCDRDFYAWTAEQVALLRSGGVSAADVTHIAEEIESMGRSERLELASRLAVLLAHLLKWRLQPGLRGNSWRLTIRKHRRRAGRVLADNPSLSAGLDKILADAYSDAVLIAERETGCPRARFPFPAHASAKAGVRHPRFLLG